MNRDLIIAASPHVRDVDSVRRIMILVILALTPSLAGSVYFFGFRALLLTLISVLTAVATEASIQRLRKLPLTINDGSAIITGILLAFNLPVRAPWWLVVIGSFVAIAVGKQIFGGLGFNPVNPALLGRAFLLASWPVRMTAEWSAPRAGTTSGIAAVTTATPLAVLKDSYAVLADPEALPAALEAARTAVAGLAESSLLWKLLIGTVGGCIGETSVILILLGAALLFYYRVIDWRIPTAYIGSVAVLAWVFGGPGLFEGRVFFHVFSGGLMLGAFFMATDMVTSPITRGGRWLFGLGCGGLTVLIRLVGGYPEGVSYSILLMNLAVPLLDRGTRPKPFGMVKR